MINNNITRIIVGILVIVYLISLTYSSYAVYDAFSSLSETTSRYLVYEDEENRIEEWLMGDGYEVIITLITNYSKDAPFFEWYNVSDDTICKPDEKYCESDKVGVIVDMKSLGTRSDQVWDFLSVTSIIYPNAFTYRLKILSPTDTCEYIFFGDLITEYYTNYDPEIRERIDEYIAKPSLCS